MPKLFVSQYRQALKGKVACVACREGILRSYYQEIVQDIKFLERQGIKTVLFHNFTNRFANQQHFEDLKKRLAHTKIVRIPSDQDFYQSVLNAYKQVSKILFIERKYLIDDKGNRINAISTKIAKDTFESYGVMIANINFRAVIDKICDKIEKGAVERVHILPAGKGTIRNELFSVEGSGTLIANDFEEKFCALDDPKEIPILFDILKKEQRKSFLKYRSKAYLKEHINDIYVTKIDGIMVGCCEKIRLSPFVVELGSVVISTKFRNQRVGVFMIKAFLDAMEKAGNKTVVSLTTNPKLAALYLSLGFKKVSPPELKERQNNSPGVTMYCYKFDLHRVE